MTLQGQLADYNLMLDRNRIHKNVEDILDECRQLEGANASERHRVDELLTHCCMYYGSAYHGPTYDAPTYMPLLTMPLLTMALLAMVCSMTLTHRAARSKRRR